MFGFSFIIFLLFYVIFENLCVCQRHTVSCKIQNLLENVFMIKYNWKYVSFWNIIFLWFYKICSSVKLFFIIVVIHYMAVAHSDSISINDFVCPPCSSFTQTTTAYVSKENLLKRECIYHLGYVRKNSLLKFQDNTVPFSVGLCVCVCVWKWIQLYVNCLQYYTFPLTVLPVNGSARMNITSVVCALVHRVR